MGFIIGDSGIGINTWAKLRGAVIQGTAPSRFDGNEVYPDTGVNFKSEEGNGLLVRGLNSSLGIADITMRMDATDFYLAAINFDDRYHATLIGEDVENAATEVYTMTSDVFVPPYYMALSPVPMSFTVAEIGLFDPIT